MELKYFPFHGEDYKPQMGLKPLERANWIEFGSDAKDQLALKERLLRDERDRVLIALPEASEGCRELREVLGAHLHEFFSDRFPENPALREQTSAVECMAELSRWTQEDWALLSPRPPVRLEAASICFPSRWDLRTKIGRESDAIHKPVPEFSSIAKPTQGFLERVSVDKPMWRLNWTIHDSDELFCPGPHPGRTDVTVENVIDKTWLRVERQTLRKLPRSGFVAFSIRTYVHSLRDVVQDSQRRMLLKASLERVPAETAEYKGMGRLHRLLIDAL